MVESEVSVVIHGRVITVKGTRLGFYSNHPENQEYRTMTLREFAKLCNANSLARARMDARDKCETVKWQLTRKEELDIDDSQAETLENTLDIMEKIHQALQGDTESSAEFFY